VLNRLQPLPQVCLDFSRTIEIAPDLVPGLQSPWIIDGQRKGVSSVEERIADTVLPAFQADRHKFMSAGMQPSALSQCKISASQMPGVVICLCTFLQFGSDVRERLFNNRLVQLLLPSRRLSCACHSDVMCCVANCIGDLDMQLASKPQLSASGMHGQKKEFSKKGRYHFVATSTFNIWAEYGA